MRPRLGVCEEVKPSHRAMDPLNIHLHRVMTPCRVQVRVAQNLGGSLDIFRGLHDQHRSGCTDPLRCDMQPGHVRDTMTPRVDGLRGHVRPASIAGEQVAVPFRDRIGQPRV